MKISQKLWVHLGKLGLDPSVCEGLTGKILALFAEFGHPQLRGRAATRLATHLVQIRIRHEYVDHWAFACDRLGTKVSSRNPLSNTILDGSV